jgi:hypothetical protein
MLSLHICAPQPTAVWIQRDQCECRTRKTLFVRSHTEWYGVTETCLRCGERYDMDEGRLERPFMPRWREDSKARARKLWRRHNASRQIRERP